MPAPMHRPAPRKEKDQQGDDGLDTADRRFLAEASTGTMAIVLVEPGGQCCLAQYGLVAHSCAVDH